MQNCQNEIKNFTNMKVALLSTLNQKKEKQAAFNSKFEELCIRFRNVSNKIKDKEEMYIDVIKQR